MSRAGSWENNSERRGSTNLGRNRKTTTARQHAATIVRLDGPADVVDARGAEALRERGLADADRSSRSPATDDVTRSPMMCCYWQLSIASSQTWTTKPTTS